MCCSVTLDKECFAAVKARAGRRTRSEEYRRNTVQEELFESDSALFKRWASPLLCSFCHSLRHRFTVHNSFSLSLSFLLSLSLILPLSTLCSAFAWPAAFAACAARFDSIAMQHEPVFIGGRYYKLSRHLSQSPWLVEADADVGDASTASASARDIECEDVCDGGEDAEAPANGSSADSASSAAPAALTASASALGSASASAGVEPQQRYSRHTLPTSIEALIGEFPVCSTRCSSPLHRLSADEYARSFNGLCSLQLHCKWARGYRCPDARKRSSIRHRVPLFSCLFSTILDPDDYKKYIEYNTYVCIEYIHTTQLL